MQAPMLDAEREVVDACFQLAAARAVAESSRRAVAALEERVRVAKARRSAGTASELDEARATAELAGRKRVLAGAERVRPSSAGCPGRRPARRRRRPPPGPSSEP